MKLLELGIIEKETDNSINYPEIPENYDGEICPYYLNKKCIFLLNFNKVELESARNYFLQKGVKMSNKEIKKELDYENFKHCFQYCPTNFTKCLAYDVLSIGEIFWEHLDDLSKTTKKIMKNKQRIKKTKIKMKPMKNKVFQAFIFGSWRQK